MKLYDKIPVTIAPEKSGDAAFEMLVAKIVGGGFYASLRNCETNEKWESSGKTLEEAMDRLPKKPVF